MEILGIREVLVADDHLMLMPRRMPAWADPRQIEIPYAAIAGVSLVEPCPGQRGTFGVSMHDGTELTVPFAKPATLDMKTAHRLACQRVRAEALTSPRS